MLSRNDYCFSLGAMFVVSVAAIQVWVQQYKENFRGCNVTDVFLLLNSASLMIMATAVDVASIKADTFINFTYVMCGVLSVVPLVYIIGLSVWWLAAMKRFVGCCFNFCKTGAQRQEIANREQSNSNNDLPHRLENPGVYVTQDSNKQTKYGAAFLS